MIALKKILKAVDVWLMSARWWADLQRKMPYNNRINSAIPLPPLLAGYTQRHLSVMVKT